MLIAGLKGCAMSMLIGAVLGAIALPVFGFLVTGAAPPPWRLEPWEIILRGVFFGAVGGAVLGAPVGTVAGWVIYWVRSHKPTEGSASR